VLSGNVAMAFGRAEAVLHAAKVITSPEVKKAGKVTARAGVLEGRLLSATDVAALANVPDRATLQAQLLGLMSGPARGLVSVMNGLPGGTARVLQARADQLAGQAAGQPSGGAAEGAAS
jgi:large subunit ribosomal protein L10